MPVPGPSLTAQPDARVTREALEHDPMVVKRLQRLRASREREGRDGRPANSAGDGG